MVAEAARCLGALEAVGEVHRCLASAGEVGSIFQALAVVVGLKTSGAMVEGLALRHQEQAEQGEMLLAVVAEGPGEHCSQEVEEVGEKFLAFSAAMEEEALKACCAQAVGVGQARDLEEVEVVRLKARGCL